MIMHIWVMLGKNFSLYNKMYYLMLLYHPRTYVSIDIMQRILSDYFRVDVVHVMGKQVKYMRLYFFRAISSSSWFLSFFPSPKGMTDVDDKIINRATKESKSITEIAQRFERDFLEDMDQLKVPIK